jgi:eukaryotic-like serine/threonine-protein kinase
MQSALDEKRTTVAEGDVLAGKYRVERVLGQGGMGRVLLATHLGLDEPVAIKVLRAELTDVSGFVDRFRREAQASVRLRSEHVCRVFDVGELEGGLPFIVMELLRGRDLAQLLRVRRKKGHQGLSVREAVLYALQAAEGLAEAHALGIVHRDVKPANLFRARRADGTPSIKILDFGIAHTGERQGSGAAVLGSANYMAPEQTRPSRVLDGRADVWALAASLYQLLAGRGPFDREFPHEVIAAIVADDPPRLDDIVEAVPAKLADVIHRGLAKDLDRRWSSMVAFAAALAPFAGSAGARQATRVAAVFAERARSRATSEAEGAPPDDAAGETATRFDWATQPVSEPLGAPALPLATPPWGVFALPLAILVLAAIAWVARETHSGEREHANASPTNANANANTSPSAPTALLLTGAAASVDTAPAGALAPPTAPPRAAGDASTGSAGSTRSTTSVAISTRADRPPTAHPSLPAGGDRAIRPGETQPKRAPGVATAPAARPAGRDAAAPSQPTAPTDGTARSPCRHIVTNEVIPCH